MVKYYNIFINFAIGGIMLLSAIIPLGLFWPYKVIDIDKVEIVTPIINSGDEVSYTVHYCKYLDISADVVSEIISIDDNNTKQEIVWLTRKSSGNTEPKCNSGIVSFPTPKNLAPGNYKIRTTLKYQPNPIRVIEIQYITPSFYISNP